MKSNKSYILLILLSFFLGSLGVDRLYAGTIGTGILKLIGMIVLIMLSPITCTLTFWIAVIWWFVDFLIAVCGGVRDGEGRKIQA